MNANLILFILSSIGMTHVIVDGSIMEWFRTLVKDVTAKIGIPKFGGVVDCYLCCGTWCGMLMGVTWLTYSPLQILGCGFAGGFLANAAVVLLNWLEASTIVNLPDDGSNS